MCVYVVCQIDLKLFGLDKKLEKISVNAGKWMANMYFGRMFCWIDEWYDLTLAECLKISDNLKNDLEQVYKVII